MRPRFLAGVCAAAVLGLGLQTGPVWGAPAEIREMEAVGAIPLGDEPPARPPRDAALNRALSDAVLRVALDLLPDYDPMEAEVALSDLLGKDPLAYATRFRILEDRGERPALFSEDPDVETEYVVVVMVHVDVTRVRRRLEMTGVLEPSGEVRRVRVHLVIEDLADYTDYAALRRLLLDGLGVRSALPVEMEPGRAVMEVDGDRRPDALLEALLAAAPPTLEIIPLATDRRTIVVRIHQIPPPAAEGGTRGD